MPGGFPLQLMVACLPDLRRHHRRFPLQVAHHHQSHCLVLPHLLPQVAWVQPPHLHRHRCRPLHGNSAPLRLRLHCCRCHDMSCRRHRHHRHTRLG